MDSVRLSLTPHVVFAAAACNKFCTVKAGGSSVAVMLISRCKTVTSTGTCVCEIHSDHHGVLTGGMYDNLNLVQCPNKVLAAKLPPVLAIVMVKVVAVKCTFAAADVEFQATKLCICILCRIVDGVANYSDGMT